MGRVISLTEALGSGAPVIAAAIGDRLGIQVVDREVLLRAAEEAGVSPETIEQAERAPSFLTRMTEWLGVYAESDEALEPELHPERTLRVLSFITNDSYRELIERVIRNIADGSEAVIIGHGSHVILKDYPNVLRVFLNAPSPTRIERVAELQQLDPGAAEKLVREHDASRRTFFEQQYNVRRNEAQNYDLCLRTEKLSFDGCVDVICAAVDRLAAVRA